MKRNYYPSLIMGLRGVGDLMQGSNLDSWNKKFRMKKSMVKMIMVFFEFRPPMFPWNSTLMPKLDPIIKCVVITKVLNTSTTNVLACLRSFMGKIIPVFFHSSIEELCMKTVLMWLTHNLGVLPQLMKMVIWYQMIGVIVLRLAQLCDTVLAEQLMVVLWSELFAVFPSDTRMSSTTCVHW